MHWRSCRDWSTPTPSVPEFQNYLARYFSNIGDLLVKEGRIPEALAALEKSLSISAKLAADHPEFPEYQHAGRDHVDRSWECCKPDHGDPAGRLAALPLRAGPPDHDQGADTRATLPDGPRPREDRRAAGELSVRSAPRPGRRARRPFRRRHGAALTAPSPQASETRSTCPPTRPSTPSARAPISGS